ncbi:MAG: hypothetical protein JJLCMIEE_01909 [Acidimicrobiales bacterium]|nr:hypothetical protein [Acidimicrobiales bacterium]
MAVTDPDDTDHPFGPRTVEVSATVDPLSSRAPALLRQGEVEVLGRMPWSSNGTFLVRAHLDDDHAMAVYKPQRGERPLWDFPPGLWRREIAAYELSEALGWGLVPPTVHRRGPLGDGSVQFFIAADFDQHYYTLSEDPRHRHAFERICVFDILSNQTDRKGGHCLLDSRRRIWAIDNGLSFHSEFKLRTVIWEFGGDCIPEALLAEVQRLVDQRLPESVLRWLSEAERDAVLHRARKLVSEGRYPVDSGGRRVPWPMV